MPLFEVDPQLNSTCNLKFSNFESLISSGPFPGVTRVPFTTVHAVEPVPLGFQPVKSLPLNKVMGFPHFSAFVSFNAGAGRPVNCHGPFFGPLIVPESVLPLTVALKTISSGVSSSALGETKVSCPLEISTLGSGRAFPQRPTICAVSCPFSSRTSSHEGYSRSGAFSVKSQRPRKAAAESGGKDDECPADLAPEYDLAESDRIIVASTTAIRWSFISGFLPFASKCKARGC